MAELRIHDASITRIPGDKQLRIHAATITRIPAAVTKRLRIHSAKIVKSSGGAPPTKGGWWVRINGQWVRHRALIRINGEWV